MLRREINHHHALLETRRKVDGLLGDLQSHDAETVFLDALARREELPLQQSMVWARWYNRSGRLEEEARKVLTGDWDHRVVLHDGQGTRQAFEEAITRFANTRAAHGEPDNSVRLERARQEGEERRRSWSHKRGGGLSM